MLTIVIPVYNQASYLDDALNGIANQIDKNFQLIVSDNCSTDHIDAVIEKHNNLEIEYHKEVDFLDKTSNWNRTVNYCKTEYTMMHHSDDILMPEAVSCINKSILSNKNIDLFHNKHIPMLSDGERLKKPALSFCFKYKQKKNENIMSIICPISIVGVTFRTSVFHKINGFNNKYQLMQDWYFYVKFLQSDATTMFTDEYVGYWRTDRSDRDGDNLNNIETISILSELNKENKSWLKGINIRVMIYKHSNFYKENPDLKKEYDNNIKKIELKELYISNKLIFYIYNSLIRVYIFFRKVKFTIFN